MADILNTPVPSSSLKEAIAMTEPKHDPQPSERELPVYSAENLPQDGWRVFRKVAPIRAIRLEGPFRVETSESENEPFLCEDGWLAVDSRGYPYAIARDEFATIYTEIRAEYEHTHERMVDGQVRFDREGANAGAIDSELLQLRERLYEDLGIPFVPAQIVHVVDHDGDEVGPVSVEEAEHRIEEAKEQIEHAEHELAEVRKRGE